jgi:hypothetical protein
MFYSTFVSHPTIRLLEMCGRFLESFDAISEDILSISGTISHPPFSGLESALQGGLLMNLDVVMLRGSFRVSPIHFDTES